MFRVSARTQAEPEAARPRPSLIVAIAPRRGLRIEGGCPKSADRPGVSSDFVGKGNSSFDRHLIRLPCGGAGAARLAELRPSAHSRRRGRQTAHDVGVRGAFGHAMEWYRGASWVLAPGD